MWVEGRSQHTYLHPRIGRVNRAGGFDIVRESDAAVRPDPYMVEPEVAGWGRFAAGH